MAANYQTNVDQTPADGIPVYVTFKWKDGLDGTKEDVFKQLNDNGFRCYRWNKDTHTGEDRITQFKFLKGYLNNDCKAYIMVIDDPDYRYGMGTYMLGSVAFNSDMPVLIVDPNDGSHPVYTNSKGEQSTRHKLVRNLGGAYLEETGRLLVAKTMDEGIGLLARRFATAS